MLVLSRRENDQIIFPSLGITVEVLRVSGSTVRLGVKAPPHVRVLRHELVDSNPECAHPLEQQVVVIQMSNHDLAIN